MAPRGPHGTVLEPLDSHQQIGDFLAVSSQNSNARVSLLAFVGSNHGGSKRLTTHAVVDAARCRIKLDFVGAADAIQRLSYFPVSVSMTTNLPGSY